MCGGTHEGTRKNHGNFTVAGIGWEEGDTRLRESQPVSFREKDERSSSKGSWKVREKDGRIIREGKGQARRGRGGRAKEGKRGRRRGSNAAGERGRKCGWNGNEGRRRCRARIEGDGARVERLDGIPIRAKSAGHYTGSVGIATS